MADLMRWSPFASSRWSSPFDALLGSPAGFMDAFDRMLESAAGPAPIRVEEFVDDKTLVVRAEMPGLDPEKDIEVSISEGVLHISAERQEKEEHKDKNRYRSEFRYGSFTRDLPLPEGIREEDIKASYTDGVLEVRTPLPEAVAAGTEKNTLPITRG
ncbi:Hsp20/alpha crystallin family protein [Arthrobacter sp. 92]|uniref:Hsp20/alpha crystallin family protein n=1 Tax=Arthrobacter sp. 92 TaxID=3418175 RepID=UPI003D00658C